jgi:uncharacterized protein YbjT (DUF2867 family)
MASPAPIVLDRCFAVVETRNVPCIEGRISNPNRHHGAQGGTMSKPIIAVTGPTGNTGKAVVEALLAKGQRVRVVGRSAEKLQPLADRGAEIAVARYDDVAAMTNALRGAAAAYLMIPVDYQSENLRADQRKVITTYASAIEASRVPRVVALSSIGAHLDEPLGPISSLREMEQRFAEIDGTHFVFLRAGYFMENHFLNAAGIEPMGALVSPIKPGLRMPQIATSDVGNAAAELLAEGSFTGKTPHELFGASEVTLEEAAQVLGAAIAKPDLKYVQAGYDEARQAMQQMGLGSGTIDSLLEMYRGFNAGLVESENPRTPAGTTKTRLEDWAPTFAAALKAQSDA